jgi:tetratricopeptide (TPR) repeat protein
MNRKANNRQLVTGKGFGSITLLTLVSCFLFLNSYAQIPKTIKSNNAPVDSAEIKKLFFSAISQKAIDQNTEAAELFNKVLQIDPSNDASLYELANIKKIQNNYTEARPLLERAVAIKPDNEWYWSSLADIYEKSNDVAKLENVFSQLIRISPDKIEYYYNEANAYLVEKRYDDALKMYDRIEQITGPSDDLVISRQKIYLKQGKVDKAAEGLEQMITANPGEVKYYLVLAEIYSSNNANDKALKVLEKAKTVDPNNALVHLALADSYREKKNVDASFKELQLAFAIPDLNINEGIRIIMGYLPKFPDPNAKASALELSRVLVGAHPDDSKAQALYGDMLFQNEKYKEAKVSYQRSIELNNQVYEAREQLVRVELIGNDIDGVIRDGESALSFFPNQVWMNYFVGVAWLQKKDYKKALGYLKNATAMEFQDKDVLSLSYSALGDCYHELQDNKNSDAAYDKSLTYNPDNGYTLNNYAYYLSVRGEQLDKAAQMAKHANSIQANVASFEDTYAWILFKQKNYKEAKAWMEKALAHGKDKSAVQTEHYGDILFYLGDVDTAVQNWKKAKEYGGHSPALDRKINEKKYSE